MYPVEHIWTILMLKILQAHFLRAFVANVEINAIYALYPESFCDKNLAVRQFFAFSDSGLHKPARLTVVPFVKSDIKKKTNDEAVSSQS